MGYQRRVHGLLWWCCTPCTIAQEARHVDAVTGVKVRCCCSLVSHQNAVAQPMVGSAISLQSEPTATPANPQHPVPPAPLLMVDSPQSPPMVITAQVVHIQPPGTAPGVMPPAFQMQPVV